MRRIRRATRLKWLAIAWAMLAVGELAIGLSRLRGGDRPTLGWIEIGLGGAYAALAVLWAWMGPRPSSENDRG